MTARDRIRRRYRQFHALGLSGLGVFLGSFAVILLLFAVLPDEPRPRTGGGPKDTWAAAVLLGGLAVGGVVAATGMVHLSLASRCPWCRGNWSLIVRQIACGDAGYCPYCERPVDGKLPATGPPGKTPAKGDWREDELA